MNANELMIDNWVMRDGIAMQVIAISGDEIACGDTVSYYPSDMYEPIPLSPEILEKCGFVKENVFYGWDLDDYHICDSLAGEWSLGIHDGEGGIQYFAWDIKYLHQLQSLLFSLGHPLNVEL